MISQTKLQPGELMSKIAGAVKSMQDKMNSRKHGDVNADKEIVEQLFIADDYMKKLIYSFLYLLENDGKLNSTNIPALKLIENMEDEIRKNKRQGINEEDYLRRMAAHFEALTEVKLKKAEKMAQHLELAKKYAKLAEQHEKIAQKQ